MSRMRKESNHQKKKNKERAAYIIKQRVGIPSDNIRDGVDDPEFIERMYNIQRFKVDSKSVKRFLEDTERADEETKRKMSLQMD